jgi:hypothetical protein
MGRDTLHTGHSFIRRRVDMRVLLVEAPESAQVVTERRAYPFAGVAVDLTSAITIVIPCTSVGAVAHDNVGGVTAVTALPCIGVQHRTAHREVVRDELVTGTFVSGVIDL